LYNDTDDFFWKWWKTRYLMNEWKSVVNVSRWLWYLRKFRIQIIPTVNNVFIYHKFLVGILVTVEQFKHTHTNAEKRRRHSHRNTHDREMTRESGACERHDRRQETYERDWRASNGPAAALSSSSCEKKNSETETGSSAASLPPTTLFSYTPKCTESIVSLNDDNQYI